MKEQQPSPMSAAEVDMDEQMAAIETPDPDAVPAFLKGVFINGKSKSSFF